MSKIKFLLVLFSALVLASANLWASPAEALSASGFVATYSFLPTQGGNAHQYQNNADRINEIHTFSSSSSSSCSVTVSCTGTGSGRTVRTQNSSVDLCGQTQTLTAGFVATYKFLPTQGSELSHLYVNNVDRINEVQTSGSGSSSSYSLWRFTPTGDATVNPVFNLRSCRVTAAALDPTMGRVTGEGTYDYGQQVTLTALPANGYRFVAWYEGVSHFSDDNPLELTLTKDLALYAAFERIDGIGETAPTEDYQVGASAQGIVVRRAARREVKVYDLSGRQVYYVAKAEEEQHIAIRYRGIYFVVIDRDPARKVMVR